MKPTVDIDELIVRPLNTIELLRAELKAGGDNDAEDTSGAAGLAGAVSALLLTGDSPALSKIPVLSRKALDEVRGRLYCPRLYYSVRCFVLFASSVV